MSRDGPSNSGCPLAIVSRSGDVHGPTEDIEIAPAVPSPKLDALPEGWEERKANNGRVYYVNHVTKSTQWDRPTQNAKSQPQPQQQQQPQFCKSFCGNVFCKQLQICSKPYQ